MSADLQAIPGVGVHIAGYNIDIDKLHTTPMGEERIRRNLELEVDDIVEWCRLKVRESKPELIVRKGKNWYVSGDGFVLTINAHSHTVITAHKTR
jgi:hypothetical protein